MCTHIHKPHVLYPLRKYSIVDKQILWIVTVMFMGMVYINNVSCLIEQTKQNTMAPPEADFVSHYSPF